jgi:hypothetical protein
MSDVPALKIDAEFRARGWHPSADALIERQIAFRLLTNLIEAFPNDTIRINDGDETSDCGRDPVAAMELIFNLDDSWVLIGKRNWVRLITGNGFDFISDYGVNRDVEQVIDKTMRDCGIEE